MAGSIAKLEHVRVGDRDIAYRETGAGRHVVLLHGFTQDSRIWLPQMEELRGQFHVVAWDAPGAGDSEDPPETFEIDDWAKALDEFLGALGIERAHIVGLSWGGLLAQTLYALFARRVQSLVLADTYAGWTGSLGAAAAMERLAACDRDSELPADEFVARYLPGMLSSSVAPEQRAALAEVIADTHPLGFRLMAAALAFADTRDLLPAINVPTLLLWGDADARSPLEVGRQMHAAIPGSQFVVIRGAGHVSNMEKPAEFSAAVRGFLSRL